RHTYRSSICRRVTLSERMPPPIGVVSGPLIPTRNSLNAVTVSSGSQSLKRLKAFSPAYTSIQAIRFFPPYALATAASNTAWLAPEMSGRGPPPSMYGRIGWSGTSSRPPAMRIVSPAGTLTVLYVAMGGREIKVPPAVQLGGDFGLWCAPMASPLRIGVLGAARITPMALLRPARQVPEVTIVAVAVRDAARATKFAKKHRIPKVHPTYAALLADREIDAVYNPLPNTHHGCWPIPALRAGKHVLCEKPLAANANEARAMAAAASESRRVLMEAFHWRYHPLAERLRAILASGEIGAI